MRAIKLDKREILLVWKAMIQVMDSQSVLTGVILPLLQSRFRYLPGFIAAWGLPYAAVARRRGFLLGSGGEG